MTMYKENPKLKDDFSKKKFRFSKLKSNTFLHASHDQKWIFENNYIYKTSKNMK